MVLGLRRFDMNGLLKSALVVLLFILGVVLLSVCPDGLGAGCEHPCCTNADRSRSLQRLVRRLRSACRSTAGPLLMSLDGAAARMADSWSCLASAQPIPKVSPLRI
jgi:hypothetical protein